MLGRLPPRSQAVPVRFGLGQVSAVKAAVRASKADLSAGISDAFNCNRHSGMDRSEGVNAKIRRKARNEWLAVTSITDGLGCAG